MMYNRPFGEEGEIFAKAVVACVALIVIARVIYLLTT